MTSKVVDIDPNTLREWLQQDRICLIDVRERYEYALARIKGGILLPTSTFSPSQLPKDETRPFVFYCKAGVRSANAARKYLNEDGVEAYNLEGGIDFWMKSGMPTEKKKSAHISIERQFQLVLGVTLLALTLLTAFVHSGFLLAIAFLGADLVFAGTTGVCVATILISKMPHNQR